MNGNIEKELLTWYEEVVSKRYKIEKIWNEVTSYLRTNGEKSTKAYDNTASIAADLLASSIWSLINSSFDNWFDIKLNSHDDIDKKDLNGYSDTIKKQVAASLYNPSSGFYPKTYDLYSDLVTYGTAIFYIEENIRAQQLHYSVCSLYSCYLDSLDNSNIDVVFRKHYATGHDLLKLIPEHKRQDKIFSNYFNNLNKKYSIVHAVFPSSHNLGNKYIDHPYSFYYIDIEQKIIIHSGGYYEFPYMVLRWSSNPGQLYGISPAMIVLSDIKMLNNIHKTVLTAIQKQVDPPMLVHNDLLALGVKTHPGGIIYGGLDVNSMQPLVQPMKLGADISFSHQLQQQKQQSIKEAFYFSLLVSNNYNNAPVTATEINHINNHIIRVIGAKISRIQSEFLHPMLIRVIGIMLRLEKFNNLPSNFKATNLNVSFSSIMHQYA